MIPLKDDNPTVGRPVVTYLLIGLCVLVFLMELGSESENIFLSYGLIPSVLMGHGHPELQKFYVVPAYVTILTSMFMHGGWIHLFFDMLYIWIFADNIEGDLGPRNFIIFYLLSGVGAAMAQVLMDTSSQVPMIGASGAIEGVMGAYLINHSNTRVLVLNPFDFFSQLIKIRALYVLGFWLVIQFIISSMMSLQGVRVAYAAHIGGFITGMVLILFFNKTTKRKTKIIKGPWS